MTSSQHTADQSVSRAGLAQGRLGTIDIVFFVVAAAAPLAVVAGAAPLAFRMGGIGAPGAYVFCGVVYILCAAGLTAFARHVREAGAFYAFIGRGLGRPAGVGSALMALLSYGLVCFGFFGFFGSYARTTVLDLVGVDLHWSVYALAGALFVAVLGYRQVDIGARVLGVLMTLEVLILLVLSVAVLAKSGSANLTLEPFEPAHVFDSGAGGMFVLALGAFIGFESTTIYSEEARNPEKSVPRATYAAVAFLALFYGFTTWIAVKAFGTDALLSLIQADDFQDVYFGLADSYLGGWAKTTMELLIVTSILAATLAFHNATARYMFTLGRDRILPASLGNAHPRFGSPSRASLVTTLGALLLIGVTVALHGEPYLHLLLWTNTVGIIGIVVLQALCMAAVIRFFTPDRRGSTAFRVWVAPVLGTAGLLVGLYLMVTNVELLTGRTDWVNWALLAPLPLLGIGGYLWARSGRGANTSGTS
ncbi:amino acid transporter [Mycobacterium frederiksbergense]|uniref:Amino acid transporter n=1 Tax=Mycolicibacterium frederiksbergense TaxID=117567 RepID=A0ABT6L902_9MYCO|nr:APC family permease [Mycolicibacterium frederiksbergense]MDH6198470.1 amino acid transporter [Mycolicibacterium frederiksbergense]